MTFLNPSILIALAAVSIPILIHLLNLRKIRKVEFSTLMFLREIQKSKMRRIKLKQLILLLLRIFTIAFLVLCFARPVYDSFAGADASSTRTTTLIFIDDSFSMNARDSKGLYLSTAKDYVKKILESHNETDEIYLIPVSQIALKDKKIFFDNFKELLDSLQTIKFSFKPFQMQEALNFSNQILNESKNPVKEIFILSDFQRNNFSSLLNKSIETKNENTVKANTFLIDIGSREVNNISLDSLIIVSKIPEKDSDIRIKIFLNNYSKLNVKNKTVNLYVDGELRGEKITDAGSFEKKEIDFAFKAGRTGAVNCMLELVRNEFSDDELIEDNKYFFTLYIPEKFKIGFVGGNSSEYNYLNLAFQSAVNIISDSLSGKSGIFQINNINEINDNIFGNNVLFISGKKNFTDNEAGIIKNYISTGGGVFLFLGKDIDVNNYNEIFLGKLGSVKIDKLIYPAENLKFEKLNFEHPLLSEVFVNKNLNITSSDFNIETPKINSYYNLLLNETSVPVITFGSGQTFLAESRLSKGKIIIAAVSANSDMSDLPLKSLFVPLIIRGVYYLGNNFEYQKDYYIGTPNIISIKNLKNISKIFLPDKSEHNLNESLPDNNENYFLLPYSRLASTPGSYILEDSSGSKFSFSLNPNTKESNTDKFSPDEVKEYLETAGIENIKIIKQGDDVSELINESRKGISLWKYFLIGAIIFLLAEIVLSKKLEKS